MNLHQVAAIVESYRQGTGWCDQCSCGWLGFSDSSTVFDEVAIDHVREAHRHVKGEDEPEKGDPVDHPAHYTAYPVEVIELTEHLSFCRGNAVKYLARAGKKEGADELEDLRKAAWYVDREIARLEAERGLTTVARVDPSEYPDVPPYPSGYRVDCTHPGCTWYTWAAWSGPVESLHENLKKHLRKHPRNAGEVFDDLKRKLRKESVANTSQADDETGEKVGQVVWCAYCSWRFSSTVLTDAEMQENLAAHLERNHPRDKP